MSHLSDQFLQQFLQDVNKDDNIPSSLKEKINELYSVKKIAKSGMSLKYGQLLSIKQCVKVR